MQCKNRVKYLLITVILAFLVFSFSACTAQNLDISSESMPESLNNTEVNIDECDEESFDGIGQGRGGELEPMAFASGEFAGQYNPADIRGSFTLETISRYYDIPLYILSEAFNIPLEEASNVQNQYFKYIFEGLDGSGKNIGNGSMIVFVSMYKGLPFDVHEPEYLLESASKILKNLGTLSQEELDYLDRYVVTIEEAAPIPLANFIPPEDYDDEYKIYGRTTFGDLIDMGISKEQISKIIDAPMPSANIRVKDYCVENYLSFSDEIRLKIYEILYDL